MAGKLSGDGDMREGALRNKTLYNFIFPLSTVGWSGSGMGVGRGRPKLLRWGEGGRCAIKLCTILFFRARRHDKAGGVLRRSPLKRPRRAMPRTARSAVLGVLCFCPTFCTLLTQKKVSNFFSSPYCVGRVLRRHKQVALNRPGSGGATIPAAWRLPLIPRPMGERPCGRSPT